MHVASERATDWLGSNRHAHLGLADDDRLTAVAPIAERFPDLAGWLAAGEVEAMSTRLRKAESIGRPLGDDRLLAGLEAGSGRRLKPARRGPRRQLSALSPK